MEQGWSLWHMKASLLNRPEGGVAGRCKPLHFWLETESGISSNSQAPPRTGMQTIPSACTIHSPRSQATRSTEEIHSHISLGSSLAWGQHLWSQVTASPHPHPELTLPRSTEGRLGHSRRRSCREETRIRGTLGPFLGVAEASVLGHRGITCVS